MRTNLVADIALADSLFVRLADATRDAGGGVTRAAYGPGERIAHAMVRAEADRIGLLTEVDPAGNLLMTLPGADRSAPRLVFGSHLDSVVRGGDYDGTAGVLAGLAVVAGMRSAGFVPARDITVLAARAEEAGAWFPTSYPGSRAALGRLPRAALALLRPDSGRSMADHMTQEGFDPDAVGRGESLLKPADVGAYVELHIEQGPVLDTAGLPVGIVTGIPGARRLRDARAVGQYNHSGATPRAWRRDAALAVAELAVGLDAAWAALERDGHQLVCTFCHLGTTPDAAWGKVPGEATFGLEARAVDPAALDALFAQLDRLAEEIAQARGVRFELGTVAAGPSAPMDPAVQAALAQAAHGAGVPYRSMPSGGGHDAAAFAQAGVAAGMLFVRNQNGSHSPDEAMRMQDFAAAAAVMMAYAAGFGA